MTSRARKALRDGTADHHRRVDRLFARFDLADPADYARFLSAIASAFLPIEAEIEARGVDRLVTDWPTRRRGHLLQADLDHLGPPPSRLLPSPVLADDAQIFGALYVLEGSRLGGAVLKRSLGEGLPHQFLGAKPVPGSWPKLLELMDENIYGPVRLGLAVDAARAAFHRFEAAGRHRLELLPE